MPWKIPLRIHKNRKIQNEAEKPIIRLTTPDITKPKIIKCFGLDLSASADITPLLMPYTTNMVPEIKPMSFLVNPNSLMSSGDESKKLLRRI